MLFFVTFFMSLSSNGQVRLITGKVIDENDLAPMPGVKIQASDTILLATTDKNGNFQIELSPDKDILLLSFIGMEWTSIKVPADCSHLEIIMMVDAIYDYITVRKENKKRYKRFKELPTKHQQAWEKGVFTASPCFTYIFNKH